MTSENKRQSTAAKVAVALPKADTTQSTSQTSSQDAALHAAIGSRVRVSTGPPNQSTIEGTIYVADPITNLLVLNVSPAQTNSISASSLRAPSGSYRFIPISQITTFQLQSLPQQESTTTTTNNSSTNVSLDTAALQTRLTKTLTQLQTMQLRQGPKGTNSADQALFDCLSRTMPMRWQGTSMIISDTYIIDKPYLPKSVRLLDGASGDLERMVRVLEMENGKLALKRGKDFIDARFSGGSGAAGNSDGVAGSGKGGVKKGG